MKTEAKRILIVDNEPELTEALKLALEEMGGFHIQSENNPFQAVATARQFAPDVIVMDIRMPGLDGADVAARLQLEDSLRDTPIVFLTGAVTKPIVARHGNRVGGLRFLPKTLSIAAMAGFLREIIGAGSEAPAAHAA